MAITNYAGLVTAVSNWAERTDDPFTARIDDFIALAETGFNLQLRLRQMEARTTLTTDATGLVALPADFIEWRRLTYVGNPRRDLEYIEPRNLEYSYPDAPVDMPRVFTIEASNIRVMPIASVSLDLLYYQSIPALSASATTNWLLTAYPNIYLWAVLAQASVWAKDMDGMQSYQGALASAMQAAQRQDMMMRGPSAIRASTVTP